jgi:lambda repressor-like predicted transcriptional regulator/regulator of replication initiation timing
MDDLEPVIKAGMAYYPGGARRLATLRQTGSTVLVSRIDFPVIKLAKSEEDAIAVCRKWIRDEMQHLIEKPKEYEEKKMPEDNILKKLQAKGYESWEVLAGLTGYSAVALSQHGTGPKPKIHRAIAQTLAVPLHELWPEFYKAEQPEPPKNGQPKAEPANPAYVQKGLFDQVYAENRSKGEALAACQSELSTAYTNLEAAGKLLGRPKISFAELPEVLTRYLVRDGEATAAVLAEVKDLRQKLADTVEANRELHLDLERGHAAAKRDNDQNVADVAALEKELAEARDEIRRLTEATFCDVFSCADLRKVGQVLCPSVDWTRISDQALPSAMRVALAMTAN